MGVSREDIVDNITKFINENSRRMAALYGEEFSDPSRWGPDIAACLIIAYIDREKGDKLWYKKAAKIQRTTDHSEKKLIVCSCHTGFLSHVGRPLLVARRLRELGHDVIFVVDSDTKPDKSGKPTQRKYIELIKEADFEIYHSPLLVGEDVIMSSLQSKGGTMGHYNSKMIEQETTRMLSVLEEIQARKGKLDFMLTDSAWTASIPADILKIPVGSLWNYLVSNYNRTRLNLPEDYPLRKVLHNLGGGFLVELFNRSQIAKIILNVLLLKWVVPYNLVRIKYIFKRKKFIGIKANLFSQLSGNLNLFPDFVAFGGFKVNHRALPIGPLNWEPTTPVQDRQEIHDFEAFIDKAKKTPLIYVTMGSTGRLDLLKLIIEALKDMEYKVAITTGGQFNISDPGPLPDNVLAISFYPGTVMCHKADLTINHGGSGSLNQAILNRLPQISIPTSAEQQWNCDLTTREGLGIQILPGDLTVDSLRSAVQELLRVTE
ncbi:MAG: hypothetical protein JXM79_24450 [Sedimentisphaerales bacterium]|nr:hypothetical protein [Sedimentisphaerales bacterium]